MHIQDIIVEKIHNKIFYGKSDIRDYQVSFEKIKRILGLCTSRTAKQSIKEIVDSVISG